MCRRRRAGLIGTRGFIRQKWTLIEGVCHSFELTPRFRLAGVAQSKLVVSRVVAEPHSTFLLVGVFCEDGLAHGTDF